jgi:head-tail adaptor
MRAGDAYHRIQFYAKQVTRNSLGASSDTWPTVTISCRGQIRWAGGSEVQSFSDERFFGKNMELTVRYNSNITETMKVRIDGLLDLYAIRYIEMIGRNVDLKLTLQKLNEEISGVLVNPPSLLTATTDIHTSNVINLAWTNNIANDAVCIERSLDGSIWTEIVRTAVSTTSYVDSGLSATTRYYYRVRAFEFYDYSTYSNVDDKITVTIP